MKNFTVIPGTGLSIEKNSAWEEMDGTMTAKGEDIIVLVISLVYIILAGYRNILKNPWQNDSGC